MPSSFGTATCTVGCQVGTLDQATGLIYGLPLGVNHTAVVPATIDHTGVDEVTVDLQAFIDAQPDGSRITFQPNGTYYCDGTLTFKGRKRLLFDLNGATIRSKQKLPLITHLTNMGITAPGDTGPYTVPGWGSTVQGVYVDPSFPGNLAARNNDQVGDDPGGPGDPDNVPILTFVRSPVKSATVTATGKPAAYKIAQIASKSFAPSTPGTGLKLLFLGQNIALARLAFITDAAGVRCQDIKVVNGHLLGTNTTGVYDAQVEGQHGINALGVDGLEVGPDLEIGHVWGDGINCTVDNPAGIGTHQEPRPVGLGGGNAVRNVYIHGVEIHHNGRQGITATGIINGLIERCNIHDNPRSGIDTEIPTSSVVKNFTIRWNTITPNFTFVNPAAYPVGSNVYFENLTVDGNLTRGLTMNANNTLTAPAPKLRWKNFTIINNVQTVTSPYNNPGDYDIQLINVDGATVTGNTAELASNAAMFFVHQVSCTGVSVHDNPLVCGPDWVGGGASYQAAGAGHGADNVTHGGNAWMCVADHFGNASNEPGVGVSYASVWRSIQLSGALYPFGQAAFPITMSLSATGAVTVPAGGSARFPLNIQLSAVGKTRSRGKASAPLVISMSAVGAQKSAASLPITVSLTATGSIGNVDNDPGHWLAGDVILRRPGWNAGPWNAAPWNGGIDS